MLKFNYDSLPKFYISLGIITLFLGFVFYIGTAWVLDQQTDKYFEIQYKQMQYEKFTNSSRIKDVDDMLKTKFSSIDTFKYSALTMAFILLIGGGFFLILGTIWWSNEAYKKLDKKRLGKK
jgi:hypothetical protein